MAPAPRPVWYDWYLEVIPAVLRVLKAFNASNPYGVTASKKAIFLVSQAYGEQSPSVVGLPSANHNRLFNAQAEIENVKMSEDR